MTFLPWKFIYCPLRAPDVTTRQALGANLRAARPWPICRIANPCPTAAGLNWPGVLFDAQRTPLRQTGTRRRWRRPAGAERAAVLGVSEGGALAAVFAASNPARVSALILLSTRARWSWASDYPTGRPSEEIAKLVAQTEKHWGEGVAVAQMAPSRASDPAFHRWWCKLERMSASPADIVALYQIIFEIDIRNVLPTIRVPTLVMHRRDDQVIPLEDGRYVAERIPGAKFVALEGADHFPWVDAGDDFIEEIEEFLTSARRAAVPDRILATLLFVDIVGSTEQAAKLGDARWRDLLGSYYGLVEQQLTRFGGRELGTAGDGVFASFDGPARAVRCAMSIREAVQALGIDVRAGVHTGECAIVGDNLGGIAVHIGARICDLAAPTEVLVSSTVKDLVAGSGLRFIDRGVRPLRGIPDEWRLFAVT